MRWKMRGVAFFLAIQLLTPVLSAREPLVFSTFLDTQPFFLVGERVLRQAYNRLGREFIIQRHPGERAIMSANSGLTDGELGRVAGVAQGYPNLVMIPVPITYGEPIVFTHNTRFEIKGWESLRPYSIGYVRGTKVIEKHTRGMTLVPVTTMVQAFKMLATDRTDLVVEDRLGGLVMVHQLGLKNIIVLTPPLLTVPIYHYLHKKHHVLIPQMETTLRKMEQDRTIQAIKESVMQELTK